ncbi:MAG: cytochrome c biogenesis protein CcdA [Firmicutes bacterium]|nr:cytochrome c biogenesis protein CcdA [Bacillota bacterium]
MDQSQFPLLVSFLAGMAFFFSPCVWPLIPAYLGSLSGLSVHDLGNPQAARAGRRVILLNALGFVLGISVVFIALGAGSSFLGRLFGSFRPIAVRAAGLLVILFGLHLLGVIRIPLLDYERRMAVKGRRRGSPMVSFTMGLAFAVGWTPCVGPVLAGILLFIGTTGSVTQGAAMLAAYSAGFAVPFLATAAAFGFFAPRWTSFARWVPRLNKAGGILLIILGVLMFGDFLGQISLWLFYLFNR